jgi:hypothetical protein
MCQVAGLSAGPEEQAETVPETGRYGDADTRALGLRHCCGTGDRGGRPTRRHPQVELPEPGHIGHRRIGQASGLVPDTDSCLMDHRAGGGSAGPVVLQ